MGTPQPSPNPASSPVLDPEEAILRRLGYVQVLYREMGGFSNFAISFTIISILAGCLTSYYIAFNNGGPVAITWGWLIVGGFCILVALAMGEIASAMPTAGALYFWASRLGGPAWGWFTGWFNLVGQIAVTAAIDYGAAIFTTALLNLWFPNVVGTDTVTVFAVYSAIVVLHFAINRINISFLGPAQLPVGVVAHARRRRDRRGAGPGSRTAPVGGVRVHADAEQLRFRRPSYWFVFGLGLLMAQYTITGYDASAHMSEETQAASRAAAWGTVMSVVLSVLLGFILLVAVTFAVPDVEGTFAAGANAVTYIWSTALGQVWAELLLFIAVVAQFFCGTASLTAASRMLFAFSRDRAVPGWRLWRTVAANRVPVNAVTAIAVLAWALMLPTLINGAIGYLVGTSIAVIGLYIAIALPILLRIRAGERFERGAWNLGRHSTWIAPLAVAWIAVICVLFLLPVSPKGIPGAARLRLERRQLRPPHRRGGGAAVRRLVPPLGPALVRRSHPGRAPRRRAALVHHARRTSPRTDGTSRAGTSPPPAPTPQPDLFGAD